MLKPNKTKTHAGLAEAQFYAERSLPSMLATTMSIAPLVLVVPLFSVARGVKETTIDATWEKAGRGTLRYRGPQLTQSHETLLFTLLKARAGSVVSDVIQCLPSELLEAMGWTDNSRNVERLREMLEHLFEARLDYWLPHQTEKDAASVRFIASKHTPGTRQVWSVTMSETVLKLFQGHLTHLNVRKRKLLREGLATYLWGYVSANDCKAPFKFEELRAASGSQIAELRDFAKTAREALKSMQDAGLIAGFKAEGDGVRVYK